MTCWVRPMLALVVLFAACDLSTDFDTAGTFDGTVTGDFDANLTGSALFGVLGDEFSLVMSGAGTQEGIAIAGTGGRPAPGTYAIEHFDAESGFLATYARDSAPQGIFRAESGELQVTSSSASTLRGTLTFDAVGHLSTDPDTELRITVTASFDARCVEAGGATCR